MAVAVLVNGPNLDRLGTREPEVYGSQTLADVEAMVRDRARGHGWDLETFQSNDEVELIERVGAAATADALIINPGALSHHSQALADAIRAAGVPAVEVHISNIHQRETWRHRSVTAAACVGVVAGLGTQGYGVALDFLVSRVSGAAREEK